MSGGEQQMLALSRAYVRPSSVVLLGEVSMGLAPLLVEDIYAALRDLADTGHCSSSSSSRPRPLAMTDTAHVLAGGRVVFSSEPCEIDEDALSNAYLGVAT